MERILRNDCRINLLFSQRFWQLEKKYLLYLVAGTIAGLGISFLEPATENGNLIFVFFCGIISVSGMTLPGLSGSFILMLIGNYVLLLVDSVNALYDTFADIFQGDFTWTANVQRIELLQILVVFTLGSLVGLVSFSHLLAYVLKRFKKETYAIIIGFIAGSLGVVWPWKEAIYSVSPALEVSKGAGEQIVTGYLRYFPHRFDSEVFFAIVFMIVGVLIVLSLDWYHLNKKHNE